MPYMILDETTGFLVTDTGSVADSTDTNEGEQVSMQSYVGHLHFKSYIYMKINMI